MRGIGLRFLLSCLTLQTGELIALHVLRVHRVHIRYAPYWSCVCHADKRVTPTKPPYLGTGPPTCNSAILGAVLFFVTFAIVGAEFSLGGSHERASPQVQPI